MNRKQRRSMSKRRVVRQKMELVAVIYPMTFGATAGCINTEVELGCMLTAISQQIAESRLRREEMEDKEQDRDAE